MMRLKKQSFIDWGKKIEVGITIIWLLYFFDVALPDPFPKQINILSYPIIAILVFFYWKRLTWVATRDLPLLLLVGTVLASIFWSISPQNSIDASRGFVRMFLFGAYLTTRYSLKAQMKLLTCVFGIGAILSIAVVLAMPSYGLSSVHQGAWEGIFAHKGMLGDAMSIGAMLFLFTALEKRSPNWLAWIGFGITIAINLLTDSSSSLISFALLLALMPLYLTIKQQYKLRTILLGMGCIIAVSIAIFIIGNLETILVDVLNQETGGRVSIWRLMIERIVEEKPWLGYGFNAFWSSEAGTYVGRYAWEETVVATDFNAHSSYMELYAGLGLLGVLVYVISLVTVFIRTVSLLLLTKKIEFFWFIEFLIFAHIAAISNVGKIASGASSYLIIYVSICLSTAVEWQRLKKSQSQDIKTNLNRYDYARYPQSQVWAKKSTVKALQLYGRSTNNRNR